MSVLRQKLFSFLTTQLPPRQEGTIPPSIHPTTLSVASTSIVPSRPQSRQSHIGFPMSCTPRSLQRPNATLRFTVFFDRASLQGITPTRTYLARRHVFINSDSATITFPSSKTDPFHTSVTVYLAASPSYALCPVSALRNLFTRFPHDPSYPLFSRALGPFSCQYLVDKTRDLLLRAGIPTTGFFGHSLSTGRVSGWNYYHLLRIGLSPVGLRWRQNPTRVELLKVGRVTVGGRVTRRNGRSVN